MRFNCELVEGRLLRRYKRFLADVELPDGRQVTAHCANPGSMLGLDAPGNRVWLEPRDGAGRKLAWSWRLVEVDFGWKGPQLVGIDTSVPNMVAAEAIRSGTIDALAGYSTLRREVRYGENSRIDILLEHPDRAPCLVEVKNVHLMRTPGLAEFPDSVTRRGAKHLVELRQALDRRHRAVMLFIIQMAAEDFALASDIDAAYAAEMREAITAGVEVIVSTCNVTLSAIEFARCLPHPTLIRQARS
jgi:sugar fermentation stimulation protein A